jgi:hypothetical protein
MSILGRIWPTRYDDAVLGDLTRRLGHWRGRIVLGEDCAVPLVIAGWGSAPSAARLALAQELVDRYDGLRPAIAAALYEHYAPYDEAVEDGVIDALPTLPRLTDVDQVWPYVTPVRVKIESLGGVETVEIAYRVAWDEEHTLGARLQAWRLVELNWSII